MRKYPIDTILKYQEFTNSQDPVLISLFQNIKKLFNEHETGTGQKYKKMNLFQDNKKDLPLKLTPQEEIYQKVNTICNKLSHDNFDIVEKEMESIQCHEITQVNVVSKLIYQKAILEHNYSYLYVKLLKKLLVEKRVDSEKINIRQDILNRVQKEFVDFIKSEKDQDSFLDKQLMGNAIFICSLYQIKFIAKTLYQEIINYLLDLGTNLEIEFLFYLLKNLPIKELATFRGTFEKLQKSKISQRIKFLIQDLLDILDDKKAEIEAEAPVDIKTETRKIMSNLLQEYPYHGDLTDIMETIQEIKFKNKSIFIAESIIDITMEHHEIKNDLYHVIIQLIDKKLLKKNNMKEGVINYLENLDNLYFDIPKIHQYFGELLNYLIKKKIINHSFININLKNKLSSKFYPIVQKEIAEIKKSKAST